MTTEPRRTAQHRSPLLIAHRTAMGLRPENTIVGIEAAIASGPSPSWSVHNQIHLARLDPLDRVGRPLPHLVHRAGRHTVVLEESGGAW